MQRVLEIADRPMFLSLERGFVILREQGEEVARVPLDDLSCLLLTGRQSVLSAAVMAAMMERGIPVVITGGNYHPCGIMLPMVGHHAHKSRLDNQIAASEPFKKRVWQMIVMAKIANQAAVLRQYNDNDGGLSALANLVGSGDPQNVEARAARAYWTLLFGADFRRRADDTINAALNYGYAVLRACVARHLVACGLHPALGLHHDNKENPFCLADDVLEPFRPFVDQKVRELHDTEGLESITPQIKRELAILLNRDVQQGGETTTVATSILSACQSLAAALESRCPAIVLPRL